MISDIAIIGAGFSGLSLAHALSKSGFKICIIDKRSKCPDLFRAEKIEYDQASLMRKLDILNFRFPANAPIGKTLNFNGQTHEEFETTEQYGISYGDTVNNLRENLPDNVEVLTDNVDKIINTNDIQKVYFSDNTHIEAKLIVIASGGTGKLTKPLGIKRLYANELRSLSFGFDIQRTDGKPFDFHGLKGFNYHVKSPISEIEYITIFSIGDRMRVNLFTQLEARNKLTKSLRDNPIDSINNIFPNIFNYTGTIKVCSSVQVMPTHFYILKNHIQPGIVIIGDEFQSVNPTTGTGLSKILNDADVLSNIYIPKWMESKNVSKNNIKKYYQDKTKISADRNSLDSWIYYQNAKLNNKIPIKMRIKQRLMLQGYNFLMDK